VSTICRAVQPSDATVPIDEGMDGLELGMSQGSLGRGREGAGVAEGAEVVQELAYVLGWRRHERRRARVVAAGADPALLAAEMAAQLLEARPRQEVPLRLE